MHQWSMDYEWWNMLIGMFIMFIFWGGIIYLVILTLGSADDSQRSVEPSSRSPLQIAQERYARGEINKAEYEEIRHELVSDVKT